jgi:ABC-type sugar transport system ATPase subunit
MGMTGKEPVLELRQITKSYPGVVALDEVNFAVHRNEIVGFVSVAG